MTENNTRQRWWRPRVNFPWLATKFPDFSLTLRKTGISLTFPWPWQPCRNKPIARILSMLSTKFLLRWLSQKYQSYGVMKFCRSCFRCLLTHWSYSGSCAEPSICHWLIVPVACAMRLPMDWCGGSACLSGLSWIFPRVPLYFNGAPGGIRDSWSALSPAPMRQQWRYVCLCWSITWCVYRRISNVLMEPRGKGPKWALLGCVTL